MKEKMIIDGVDVSGCEFRTTRFLGYEGQNYCEIYDCVCEEPIGDDCDHKQLQRTTVQYNTVVEQNKSLQSELLSARSEVSQKTDYIREQLEIIKHLKDKNRELRIEKARLSNELTIDIKKQLKQKENEIAHQKTLTETYRACYLAKYEDLAKELENKKQECERMRGALNKIRNYELGQLDIDWDEYETCCRDTEYSPIIDYCEVGLGEVEDD